MGNDSSVENKRICASLTSFSRSKGKVGSYEADSVVSTVKHPSTNSISNGPGPSPSSASFSSAKDLDIAYRPDSQLESTISAQAQNGSAALISYLSAQSEDARTIQYGFQALLRQLPHYNESVTNNGSGGLSLSLPKRDPQAASTASSRSLEGGVPLVIHCMKRFPHVATLQEAGCALLWLMSSRSEDEERIRELRGVSVVVAAMKAFPTHSAIQRQGCGALYNLATRLSTRFEVGTVDEGIVVILRALRYHVDERDVCQHACAALMSLADDNRNKATMAEQDGIALLLAAMKRHILDEVVCMHACGALHNLCYQNGANKVSVKEHDGISLIIEGMNCHLERADEISRGAMVADATAHMQNNGTLLQRACGVLWNLTCHNDTNKVLVAQSGGIETIVRAMRAFAHHSSIQREAAGALRNISAIGQNKALIARKDVIETLLSSMLRHLSFAEIQEQACVVLYNVCINVESVELILNCGGLEAVHSALRAHPNDVSVQEEGFGCLCKFARTGLAQKRDVENVSLTLASKALAAHPAHPGVTKYAQGLINEWANPHLLRAQQATSKAK